VDRAVAATGPGNVGDSKPRGLQGSGKLRLGARRRDHGANLPVIGDGAAAHASSQPADASRKRHIVANLLPRSTWRARNSQRSVDASHCDFKTLAHN